MKLRNVVLITMYQNSGEVPADSENILSPHFAVRISKPKQQKHQDSEVHITYCSVSELNAETYVESPVSSDSFLCSIYLDQKGETNFSCNFIQNYFAIQKINQKAKKPKHPPYNIYIFSRPLVNIFAFKMC